MDDMPKVILGVVVSMIVLGVGTFAFFATVSNIGYQEQQTQTFNVIDPTVDQVLVLSYYPASIDSVYQYNGFSWVIVDPIYYSAHITQVTVDHAGLQG
jgi:uncharacterized membrane protein